MAQNSYIEALGECESSLARVGREKSRLERMVRISRLLNSTLDLQELLQFIIQTATEMLASEAASILLEDLRTGSLYFAAATGSSAEELRDIEVPTEGSIAGIVFHTGEVLVVSDVKKDPDYFNGVDQQTQFTTHSILAVPLQVHDYTIGVLEAVNKQGEATFTAEDMEILQTLAAQAAVAIYNARLVTTLREANQQLSELDKVKSDFISIAAHELRTPLGIVIGYAHLLQEETEGELGRRTEKLLGGAMRLRSVIESLTNLNYLESKQMQLQLNLESVDLGALISEVVDVWQPLMAGKKQTLRKSLPESARCLRLDAEKIVTVLNNLLNNAMKFTAEGGMIKVSMRHQTGKVLICISDTGVGIPQSKLSRIFERFYQVEDHMTRRYQGIGLGLSVAKRIVELHGGYIWAESVEGKGSRFLFNLPRNLEATEQVGQ
ncbi:MAG: GAF domain-containing sensor histidine kinase [Chloroflexota bacterium]|nr:GAF domain-containing sensor histidine kinase [Chloroflexota bacterium]